MPDRYFNRVPSLPATDDGSARPLAEDPSTGSDDDEDITWDADTAAADEVPAAAGPDAGPPPAGAEPAPPEATSAPGLGARLQAAGLGTVDQPGTGATARANGNGDAAGEDAAAGPGESGRWFRPTKAKKRYAPVPPEETGDGAV